MRDVLAVFLNACLAQGEWRAALVAVQSSGVQLNDPSLEFAPQLAFEQVVQLSGALIVAGRWREALAVARQPVISSGSISVHGSGIPGSTRALRAYCKVLQAMPREALRVYTRPLVEEALSAPALCPVHAFSSEEAVRESEPLWNTINDITELKRLYEMELSQCAVIQNELQEQSNRLQRLVEDVAQQTPGPDSVATTGSVPSVDRRTTCCLHTDVCESDSLKTGSSSKRAHLSSSLSDAESVAHLRRISESSSCRHNWLYALSLLEGMQRPSRTAMQLVLPILVRHRQAETVEMIVEKYFVQPSKHNGMRTPLQPCEQLVKTITEAGHTLHSRKLCLYVLNHTKLRDCLTPSSAVPLVLALQHLGEWRRVLNWWNTLPSPAPEGAGRQLRHTRVPLQEHLKLSSYVAVCVAKGSRQWLVALDAFRYSASHDRDLALLFALRAIRLIGEWQGALYLLAAQETAQGRDWLEHSRTAGGVRSLLLQERADHWIPQVVVAALQTRLMGPSTGANK